MTEKSSESELDEYIIQTIGKDKPETVSQLVTLIKQKHPFPEKQVINHVLRLEEIGKIRLRRSSTHPPQTLAAYLSSGQAAWYWITLLLTAATVLVVLAVPEGIYLLAYSRIILGTIFLLWLPGYAFIKALFPKQLPIKASTKDMDTIERIALSVGMSIAFVPIVGLLLNYTPWGIRLAPVTFGLAVLTLTFATAALIREHQTIEARSDKH